MRSHPSRTLLASSSMALGFPVFCTHNGSPGGEAKGSVRRNSYSVPHLCRSLPRFDCLLEGKSAQAFRIFDRGLHGHGSERSSWKLVEDDMGLKQVDSGFSLFGLFRTICAIRIASDFGGTGLRDPHVNELGRDQSDQSLTTKVSK